MVQGELTLIINLSHWATLTNTGFTVFRRILLSRIFWYGLYVPRSILVCMFSGYLLVSMSARTNEYKWFLQFGGLPALVLEPSEAVETLSLSCCLANVM